MIKIELSNTIQTDPVRVFRFIANPENNPAWQGGMKSCILTNGKEVRLGSEYEQVAEFMGKKIITRFLITAFEEDHMIRGESVVSSFPITFQRMVEPEGHGARVSAIVTGDPSGFLKVVPWFTRWMVKRSIRSDYKRLKKLMETTSNLK